MPPTITKEEKEKRISRYEELSRSARSHEFQILSDYMEAQLDDIKTRLDVLEP